jgi:hypothetical protein
VKTNRVYNIFALYYISPLFIFFFYSFSFCSPTKGLRFPDQTVFFFQFDTDEVTTILLYKHHKMPTTFCFLFFCWDGLHDAHKTHYAHTVKYFFVTFLFISCVCVWWTVGRRKKDGDVFRCWREIRKHEIKHGAVLIVVDEWVAKANSWRSQMCVQKHWISLLEIINKKFSCFSFLFSRLRAGGYTSTQSIYSAPIVKLSLK